MRGLTALLLASGLSYDNVASRRLTKGALALVNHTSKLASVDLTSPAPVAAAQRFYDRWPADRTRGSLDGRAVPGS